MSERKSWFDLAKKIALLSDHPDHKIGAVIANGNRIISVGFNQMKTHPRSMHPHKTLHAEMAAIIKARSDLTGTQIYVYRQLKNGQPAISKPCSWCQAMINEAGIREVYHS